MISNFVNNPYWNHFFFTMSKWLHNVWDVVIPGAACQAHGTGRCRKIQWQNNVGWQENSSWLKKVSQLCWNIWQTCLLVLNKSINIYTKSIRLLFWSAACRQFLGWLPSEDVQIWCDHTGDPKSPDPPIMMLWQKWYPPYYKQGGYQWWQQSKL